MKLDLMFVGSESILNECRHSRREAMGLVSAMVDKKFYGTTFDLLGVNVVFQDAGSIPLSTDLSRERKEIGVDVEVSRAWTLEAEDNDIKRTLLQCLIRATERARQHSTEDDDFYADELIADLKRVANELE
jgi:hypothetical protein